MTKIFKGMSEMTPDTAAAQPYEQERAQASRRKAAQCVPDRVCNSTSRALYTGPAWRAARAGSDANQQIKSRGF